MKIISPPGLVSGVSRFISAASPSPIVESPYSVALNPASNSFLNTQVHITGAATAGSPSTGYINAVDLTSDYSFVWNESGHNEQLGGNDGRTGVFGKRVKLLHDGQGDLVAFNFSGRARSALAGATHWLASPAIVGINGTLIAEADGVYLNPIELDLTDKPGATAYNAAAAGLVFNMSRNAASGVALGQPWWGYRTQSTGAAYVDAMFSGTGKFFGGIDFSMAALDFGANKGAILLKANDRIIFNASAAGINDGTTFLRDDSRATGQFTDYMTYNSSGTPRLSFVFAGVEKFWISAAGVNMPTINIDPAGTGIFLPAALKLNVGGQGVVGGRKTGWTPATGTATRSTFDTASVTLPQLAEHVKALIDDLHITAGHGLIGT